MAVITVSDWFFLFCFAVLRQMTDVTAAGREGETKLLSIPAIKMCFKLGKGLSMNWIFLMCAAKE